METWTISMTRTVTPVCLHDRCHSFCLIYFKSFSYIPYCNPLVEFVHCYQHSTFTLWLINVLLKTWCTNSFAEIWVFHFLTLLLFPHLCWEPYSRPKQIINLRYINNKSFIRCRMKIKLNLNIKPTLFIL